MNNSSTEIDWSLTTWEGSRRAQLRQWRKLSLRERLCAVEEMADLSRHFADMREQGRFQDLSKTPGNSATGTPREKVGKSRAAGEEAPRPATGGVQEQHREYNAETVTPKTNKPDKGSDDAG